MLNDTVPTGDDMSKLELLAPAGNWERFIYAVRYGADAVYIGADAFSLRNLADNFTRESIPSAVDYAHARNVRVYVTVNAFLRDNDTEDLIDLLRRLDGSGADALIVNDPGAIRLARRHAPSIPLHLSTQANTLNSEAALFWYEQGVERIVLARELTLEQIRSMRRRLPKELELEMFVHGAMCVSYSGRCLLSNYIDGRDSNRGECVQPCRWNYELKDGVSVNVLSAEFREHGKNGEYLTIEDDGRGSFILNSRDMCLAPYIREIEDAGVSCVKIEGRMKSILYVATVVNAYRMAIDGAPMDTVMRELMRISHRPYTTGFAFRDSEVCRGGTYGNRDATSSISDELMEYDSGGYISESQISAVVLDYDEDSQTAFVEQRNRFVDGDTLSILAPSDVLREFVVKGIRTEYGEAVAAVPHPKQRVRIGCSEPLRAGDILRKHING